MPIYFGILDFMCVGTAIITTILGKEIKDLAQGGDRVCGLNDDGEAKVAGEALELDGAQAAGLDVGKASHLNAIPGNWGCGEEFFRRRDIFLRKRAM